jgi:hypothetical protein
MDARPTVGQQRVLGVAWFGIFEGGPGGIDGWLVKEAMTLLFGSA